MNFEDMMQSYPSIESKSVYNLEIGSNMVLSGDLSGWELVLKIQCSKNTTFQLQRRNNFKRSGVQYSA